MMKGWKKTLINADATLLEAMEVLDSGALQIALVVDDMGRLLGTITDGDIRRAILSKVSLEDSVDRAMFTPPTTASIYDDREKLLDTMRRKDLKQIPLIDSDGVVVGLKVLMDLLQVQPKDNWVVLMAGGLGTRLRPLTDDCPKPLLKVGGQAILETIIKSFIDHGFRRFFISVNYKRQMIENHFGDGRQWDVRIEYLREKETLGTAGALRLLPGIPADPLIVMNGDLLTKINFNNLLEFHKECRCQATMCVREYNVEVPFGVAEIDRYRLVKLEEKPTQIFFINAGIYVLEPQTLELIPGEGRFDMTHLFDRLLAHDERPAAFPIREYWRDIGQVGDYRLANGDYRLEFNNDKEVK